MNMNLLMPKAYDTIVTEINSFNPVRYGKTRNYKTGTISFFETPL